MTRPSTHPLRRSTAPRTELHEPTLRFLSAIATREAHRDTGARPSTIGAYTVGDVMTTGVVAAHEEAVFKEIVAALARNHISAVPVIDDDRRVLGVVSEGDLVARIAPRGSRLPRGLGSTAWSEQHGTLHALTASELMTAPAVVATAHMPIPTAVWHAARCRVRRLPVVDDAGILVGIVTRGDLLRCFLRPDDEIRDDIVSNLVMGTFILDPDDIDVEVDEGVVTLRGRLPTRTSAEAFIADVHGVAGVIDVDARAVTSRDP